MDNTDNVVNGRTHFRWKKKIKKAKQSDSKVTAVYHYCKKIYPHFLGQFKNAFAFNWRDHRLTLPTISA